MEESNIDESRLLSRLFIQKFTNLKECCNSWCYSKNERIYYPEILFTNLNECCNSWCYSKKVEDMDCSNNKLVWALNLSERDILFDVRWLGIRHEFKFISGQNGCVGLRRLARMVSRRTSSNVVSCVTLMLTINFTSLGVPSPPWRELRTA